MSNARNILEGDSHRSEPNVSHRKLPVTVFPNDRTLFHALDVTEEDDDAV